MPSAGDRTIGQLSELARRPMPPGVHGAAVLDAVGWVLPHDGYALIGLDPVTGLRTFMLSRNGVGPSTTLAEHEFTHPDLNLYRDLALQPLPAGVTNATDDRGSLSPRMRFLLLPSGYPSELRLVLRLGGRVWGILWLVRSENLRPFSDADAVRAVALAPALTEVVRRFTVRPSQPTSSLHAASLLLGPDDSVLLRTTTLGAWLTDLTAGGEDDVTTDDALRTLFDASHGARVTGTPVSARLRTMSGRWAHLLAEPVGTDEVSLTLAHATPRQLLPAFAQWHGLTEREQQAVGLVMAGESTKGIARILGISRFTAEDHLRSVYRKTDCPGREPLIAAFHG